MVTMVVMYVKFSIQQCLNYLSSMHSLSASVKGSWVFLNRFLCSTGIKCAGIKCAGIKCAGIKCAGIKCAGIKCAGIKCAGIKRCLVSYPNTCKHYIELHVL